MEKYNLDKLVKVTVHGFYKSYQYVYKQREEVKNWRGKITVKEEGIYERFQLQFVGIKLENHTDINGVLFENPSVFLEFEGGIKTAKYFETLQEAENFAKELTNKRNWLTL